MKFVLKRVKLSKDPNKDNNEIRRKIQKQREKW